MTSEMKALLQLVIPEDILLRIDLDMNLLKPLDEKLFDGIDDSTIIG